MRNSIKINFQKERDFSDIINITFHFVGENFKALLFSLLYLAGPLILLSGIFAGLLQIKALSVINNTTPTTEDTPAEVFGELLGKRTAFIFSYEYLAASVFSFLATVMVVTIVYAFIIEYQESDDSKKISIAQIWERVKSLFITTLLSFLSISVVFFGILSVFGGFIFFLVSTGSNVAVNLAISLTIILACFTTVYLGIIFLLNTPIVTFEYTGIWQAFGRANYLIQKKWWQTFSVLIIFMVINYFISLVFSFPEIILTAVNAVGLKYDFEIGQTISVIATTVLSALGRIVVSSLTYLAITFQYFSLVEGKEGNSLKSQISAIGQKNRPQNDDEESF